MTEQEIEKQKKVIDNMSHEEMARKWRFAPAGDPFFRNDLPLFGYFNKRFDKLGGWTPEISKKIGWG